MKRVVLDASAVMAFFEDRPGANSVEELIARAVEGKRELIMSRVNWGELYYSVWLAKGHGIAEKMLVDISQLPIDLRDPDAELTMLAAEFRARHKLAYAACFAAALAKNRRATLVASDQNFRTVGREIPLVLI